MKEIRTKYGTIKVDDDDYEKIKLFKWYSVKTKSGNKYALTSINTGVKCKECGRVMHKTIKMHHLVIQNKNKMVVDHINGDGLDNRKENLRLVTKGQNNVNRIKSRSNKTGFKGVIYKKQNKFRPYISRLRYEGKDYFGGCYYTAEEAARSYDELALKIHGEYAKTNFNKDRQ